MKTALPIILLIVLAFGVTYITQFTGNTPTPTDLGFEGSSFTGPPLEFPTSERVYDPIPARPGDEFGAVDLANKHFPGFFEIGTEGNFVPFFFRNTRPEAVKISALVPSCTKCTSARVAVLPESAVSRYLELNSFSTNWGFAPAPDLLSAIAWAEVYQKLDWHQFDFGHPEKMATIPGATSRPTWGIVELSFKVSAAGPPSPVSAFFDLYSEKDVKLNTEPTRLTVMFGGREPYDVYPLDKDVGEMPEGITPRTFDIYAYSSTRDEDQFPAPTISLPSPDPFISIAPPQPLDRSDLLRLAAELSGKGPPVRVRSGYRYTVTVKRNADGKSQDVGKFEKDIFCGSNITSKTYRILLRGNVKGLVKLEDSKAKIDFGIYDGTYGKKLTPNPRIISDRSDLEIELVPEQCTPSFVQCVLGKPEDQSGRRSWQLQLHINPNEGRSPPWEGSLVFRTKGAQPTLIRVPISGHGR